MPKAARISPEEKENILLIAAKMKAEDPGTTLQEIGNLVDRSKTTISTVLEDDKFLLYKNKMRKKIEKTRLEAIGLGDKQIVAAVKKGKLKPYQIIGMSKTYWEQIFPLEGQQGVSVNGNNVAVQIVRKITHNNPSDTSEAK